MGEMASYESVSVLTPTINNYELKVSHSAENSGYVFAFPPFALRLYAQYSK